MTPTSVVRRYGDWAIGLVAGATWVLSTLSVPGDRLLAQACGVGIGAALVLRRRLPLASCVVVLGLFALTHHAQPRFTDNAIISVLVLLLSLYSLGAHGHAVEARLAPAVVLAAVLVVANLDGDLSVGGIAFYVAITGGPWGAGLVFRLRGERVRAAEERNRELREQGARAVAEERARIARELHDVVSHAIAVTVLQSRGARKLVGRDDDAVRAALLAIEQTNTAALADMRRLLTLLRSPQAGGDGRDEPAPTLDRLDRLVDQVRASGLPVDLAVSGDPLPVPPGLDLSAYRIVQEALTNVLKHGGPGARARVEVRYDDVDLTVEVTNTGGVAEAAEPGGHGLVGIRERVAVAGGSVETGPVGDGYAVRARMPYLVPS